MKPTLEQYREGATTWKREHRGVQYTLSHHGISDYSPEGTWCQVLCFGYVILSLLYLIKALE